MKTEKEINDRLNKLLIEGATLIDKPLPEGTLAGFEAILEETKLNSTIQALTWVLHGTEF